MNMTTRRIALVLYAAVALAGTASFAQQQAAPPPAAAQPSADDFEILKNQLQVTEQQRSQAESDFAAQRAQMAQLARSYNTLVQDGAQKDARIKELEAKVDELTKAAPPAPPADHPQPPQRP
jgi:chromosome segregation ATPase